MVYRAGCLDLYRLFGAGVLENLPVFEVKESGSGQYKTESEITKMMKEMNGGYLDGNRRCIERDLTEEFRS